MTENNSSNLKINLITLGNSTVGKTCFIYRYVYNKFLSILDSTFGTDYSSKKIQLPSSQTIKLNFQDTAGQERYKAITLNLVKQADGILLIYDITKIETFEAITEWIEIIKEIKGNDFPIVLIGNKCDLENKRKITKEDGEKKAQDNGFLFFETSCKNNINIQETVNAIVDKITEGTIQSNERKSIKLDEEKIEEDKLEKHKEKCTCSN